MSYATDGNCHNAQKGSYNHECGQPAKFIGTTKTGFRSGFCAYCRKHGDERFDCVAWEAVA
jgi:hypothetical protein